MICSQFSATRFVGNIIPIYIVINLWEMINMIILGGNVECSWCAPSVLSPNCLNVSL